MTREKAKELLPIIQAWTEGKEIQLKSCSGEWIDIKENEGLSFRYSPSDYRIKPKPKYRPFKKSGRVLGRNAKTSAVGMDKK